MARVVERRLVKERQRKEHCIVFNSDNYGHSH